jgi:hypothetical protein
MQRKVDSGRRSENSFSMARHLFIVAAIVGLGCGDDGATIIGGGGAPGASAGGGGGEVAQAGGAGASGLPGSEVVTVGDGEFSSGEPPPTAGAEMLPEIVSLTGPEAVTNGGTAILHVQLSRPIEAPRFVVGLDGDSGYHTVTGVDPEGDGVFDIAVQVAAEATQTSLVFSVALSDEQGNVGPYSLITVGLLMSGTGDVKVTLSFDRLHDLDLHVVEPNGDEIFYDHPMSETGGQLDLDSGSQCMTTSANAENIFWPPGGAPAGDYRVFVQNYQQCSAGDITFTVRVAYDSVVNTYTGTFSDGTAGEVATPANVREIITFRRGL